MGVAVRLLAVAVVFAAIAGSGSAAPKRDRILDELEALCVRTQAEPAAIQRVAASRGYQSKPGVTDQLFQRPEGKRPALTVHWSRIRQRKTQNGFADLDARACVIFVGASVDDLQGIYEWAGRHQKAPANEFIIFSAETPTGLTDFPQDFLTRRRVLDAGALRMIWARRTLPYGVRVDYLVMAPSPEA